MKVMMKVACGGVLAATMLPVMAAAQSPTLEPLFRAGVVVSTTFRDNPVKATLQPFNVELEVADTKAATARDKQIVLAYKFAYLDLSTAASSYEFALKMATARAESEAKTAAMKKEMERNLLPSAPRPGTLAAQAQAKQDQERLAEETATAVKMAQQAVRTEYLPKIDAALKKLDEAKALYIAVPEKPVPKPTAK